MGLGANRTRTGSMSGIVPIPRWRTQGPLPQPQPPATMPTAQTQRGSSMAVSAYILVRCRGATEGKVAEIIRTKPHVKRVDTVFGDYDIIAYLEFAELPATFSVAELHGIVTEEIRKVEGVSSTSTHIVTTPYHLERDK
ncbi:TPA: hypothetical protein DCY65_03660 [Candidatus Acetothermia bacterium]|nr:hypothetical protein [Candidatus Acetothermia bacterium]